MIVVVATGVNDALETGFRLLMEQGVERPSRNGPVRRVPGPVCTVYSDPRKRVLFCPRRDANVTFHLMEAIWMLTGANDVEWLLKFNKKFGRYAEGGRIMHGAYGHRWRRHFHVEQINGVIKILHNDPTSRQAVIGMWDPSVDLLADVLDRPCNTHIYFELDQGELNMTVCCRSNDVLWGAYGSNVVHFSILQELIATALGANVGAYFQISNNYHVYTELPLYKDYAAAPPVSSVYDYYANGIEPTRLLRPEDGETFGHFIADCQTLVAGGKTFRTWFFNEVAYPLCRVYLDRTNLHPLRGMPACDWKLAAAEWYKRRDYV